MNYYRSLEDLPVWKAAILPAVRVLKLTESGALRGRAGLRDQTDRAVVSISNNIAEGFERGTHADRLTFLYHARGSAGETRSMLAILQELDLAEEFDSEIRNLYDPCLSISKQMGAWLVKLKESESRGDRFQTDQTRASSTETRRRQEYLEYLDRIKSEGYQFAKPPSHIDPPRHEE